MAAIRIITRVQDQDDFQGPVGAEVDGFTVVWDNAIQKFRLEPPFDVRITEDGQVRLTEDGSIRVIESII